MFEQESAVLIRLFPPLLLQQVAESPLAAEDVRQAASQDALQLRVQVITSMEQVRNGVGGIAANGRAYSWVVGSCL